MVGMRWCCFSSPNRCGSVATIPRRRRHNPPNICGLSSESTGFHNKYQVPSLILIAKLTDFSRQIVWRSQLMARRLADSNQVSQKRALPARGGPAKKREKQNCIPHATILPYSMETQQVGELAPPGNDQLLVREI